MARSWSIRQRIAYSTIGVVGGLLCLELILRAAGFRYSSVPMSMEYVDWIAASGHVQNTSQGSFQIEFRADPEFLWMPVPKEGVTNRLGFRGREWDAVKPAGTIRVICLGDSCTIAGEKPYPERLEEYLNATAAADGRYEVFNAGIGSWSSFQGRLLLEKRLLDYRPDVVTVYFGWNDHWLAWSHPDKDLLPFMSKRSPWINLTGHIRLAQALTWSANRLASPPDPRDRRPPLFRVSVEDYADNLRTIGRLAREAGAVPVFLTAPTGLYPDHRMVQILHSRSRLFHEPARINAVHDAYNGVVRETAKQERVPLLDLAQAVLYRPDSASLFTDGIHLTEEGLDWVARALGDLVSAERPR